MRTTVNIHDGLLETVKQRAHERGQTVGDVLEEALQYYLTLPAPTLDAPAELPVFEGRPGVRPGVDLSTNAGLDEAMYAEEDAAHAERFRRERS